MKKIQPLVLSYIELIVVAWRKNSVFHEQIAPYKQFAHGLHFLSNSLINPPLAPIVEQNNSSTLEAENHVDV